MTIFGFVQLTTEVAPGAGTKLLAIQNDDGTYTQVVSLATGPTNTSSQIFLDSPSNATTPGIPQDLISDVIPVGKIRFLSQVIVVCRAEGSFVVTADGAIIGEGKTGPANPNAAFTWSPNRPLTAGTELKVTFTAAVFTKDALPVSAYLQATETNA